MTSQPSQSEAVSSSKPVLLEMRRIRKQFPGVLALDDVDFDVRPSEVHALVGENGAGKSTLVKILSGALQPDSGEIVYRGRSVRFRNPHAAQLAGIAMIHQELSLVPSLSVAENILLGHEPAGPLGVVQPGRLTKLAAEFTAQLGLEVDLGRPVEDYNIATQQMIEVAKALSHSAGLIIMDEPTSALSEAETTKLFDVVRMLKARGVAVVYITHKLEEIYDIADRITVLRDGRRVGTSHASELPPDTLIQWMVGRRIEQLFPKSAVEPGEELLRVEGLCLEAPDGSGRRLLDDVSLDLHAGEIVGLAGLRGAGSSELLGAVFGQFGRLLMGELFVRGRSVRITSPVAAIENGIAMLTNDRKANGLVLPMSVLHNASLASLKGVSRWGWILRQREEGLAGPLVRRLGIRTPSLDAEVGDLSGGNQQKVVLAKWLMTEPHVLLLDEPTRGIDVGAKVEIYHLMNELVAEGKGILLITSELPELLGMSDRILVMHRGRITARFTRAEATQERVIQAAMEAVPVG